MNSEPRVKFSALAPVTSQAQLLTAVNNLITNLSPLLGQHKNKEEKVVQWADLMQYGLVNVKGFNPDGSFDVTPPVVEKPDMSTPPDLVDFKAVASFNFITFSWKQPVYKNHSHVELWRAPATKKNAQGQTVPTVLGDAVFRLMTPSAVCSDTVLPGDTWRYWARNVSQTGVAGQWTSVDGLAVSVPEDPAYLIDKISGEIRESDLYPELGNKIDVAYDGFYSNSATITSQGQTIASHTQTLASHGTAISQNTTINNNQQGLINAAWTVRIDTGNAVSGFGLMVDGATGRSDFIIRADRFAVAAPQAYDQAGRPIVSTAAFPFIVDVTNPNAPRVLIKNAVIDQAFITSLVTSTLVADRITGQTITGTHIRGGDMAIGSNFSVDGAGNMIALNAFLQGTVQSANYGAGTAGWSINNNGNAEFNNAVLRGTVYAEGGYFKGSVYVDKLIGDVVRVYSMQNNVAIGVAATAARSRTVTFAITVCSGNSWTQCDIYVNNVLSKTVRSAVIAVAGGASISTYTAMETHSVVVGVGQTASIKFVKSAGDAESYNFPGAVGVLMIDAQS